jgi:hypothetical protein
VAASTVQARMRRLWRLIGVIGFRLRRLMGVIGLSSLFIMVRNLLR